MSEPTPAEQFAAVLAPIFDGLEAAEPQVAPEHDLTADDLMTAIANDTERNTQ